MRRELDPNLRRILDEEREHSSRALGYVRFVAVTIWVALTWIGDRDSDDLGLRLLAIQRPWIVGYFVYASFVILVVRRIPLLARWRHWSVPIVDVPIIFLGQFASMTALLQDGETLIAASAASFTIALTMIVILPAATGTRAGANVAAAFVATLFCIFGIFLRPEYPRFWMVNTALLYAITAVVAVVIARRPERVARKYVEEQKLRRYFSPSVAERIVATAAGGRGESREITVLFADVRGFTNLSEKLDAEHVVSTLNEWFAAAVPVVFAHGGTLDKYMGDGLMAYFGAPAEQADHAARAVRCAGDLLGALDRVNDARRARGEPTIAIGIGVHTGRAVVGEIGAPERLEYTAVGDTVNTAARLESMTKDLGAAVLVSQATREAAGDAFLWNSLGTAPVRGREAPVALFSPSRAAAA